MAGLYVHVPFRRARRSYDDSDYVAPDDLDFGRYTTALCREMRYFVSSNTNEEAPTTLYVGGGRPSLLPLSTARSILAALREAIAPSALMETTVEVNPADATPRTLRALSQLGVDRLSLAILSFSPAVLQAVGAPHSADDARRALDAVRRAGFATWSIDLLFGVSDQSLSTWTKTLQRAVGQRVPHIAIIEAPPGSNEPGIRADQLEQAMMLLGAEGYEQYELTHFALPGHRSLHQENYYAHGSYLGVGPSAESFWRSSEGDATRARRWRNVSAIDRYANLLRRRHPPITYRQTLNQHALAQEYVLLRLRTSEGLDLHRLRNEYDLDLRATSADLLDRLRNDELIHDDPNRIRLTARGRLLTDAITQRLLSF